MEGETLTERSGAIVVPSEVPRLDLDQTLSRAQIETIATRAWQQQVQVAHFEIESYSKEKVGYLGLHKCLKISVYKQSATTTETKSFFVKCFPRHDAFLTRSMQELGVFEQEVAFYGEVIPLLEQCYKGDRWFASCYLITPESMVLEDLRSYQFSMRGKLLTLEETVSALGAIARMHAASILAERKLNRLLCDAFPRAFSLFSYYTDNPRTRWFKTGIDLLVFLAEYLGLDSSKVKDCCETWISSIKPSKTKQNAITHSDLWSNNIMFDRSDPPRSVLVDFQMSRYCPIAQDVIVFLHLCTNRSFRQSHQKQMLEHYYNVLVQTLRINNAEAPSWQELLEGVEENTPCAVSIAALYFPSVLIDGETSARMFADPDTLSRFMYVDRRAMVLDLIKQDKEYADRLLESVQELVQVSFKLDQYPVAT